MGFEHFEQQWQAIAAAPYIVLPLIIAAALFGNFVRKAQCDIWRDRCEAAEKRITLLAADNKSLKEAAANLEVLSDKVSAIDGELESQRQKFLQAAADIRSVLPAPASFA